MMSKAACSLSPNCTPAVTVEGKVDGYPVQMFVDTGSMVTLLQEDCWREITSISGKELKQPVRLVVEEELDIAGQYEVCTVYSSDEGPICHNVASSEKEVGHRNHALQQLEQGAEGLSKEEKMALRSLLNSYVDVFALVDGEFSKSNKINTQGAEPVKHAAQKAMAIPQKRREPYGASSFGTALDFMLGLS
eukprot:Em0012g118a